MLFSTYRISVDGVTVSIGAFQALVPGSTPGRRSNNFFQYFYAQFFDRSKTGKTVSFS